MANWARVEDGVVREVIATELPLASLYHPALAWVPADAAGVAAGWLWDGSALQVPPMPAPIEATPGPTLATLEAQLSAFAGQLAQLRA